MKNVSLFLFDLTGIMAKPWLDAGYTCYIVDIQHPLGVHQDKKQPGLFKVGADLRNGWLPPSDIVGKIAFVAAFPECTNVAVSGAAHFLRKGPRALSLSLDLFATSKELGEIKKATQDDGGLYSDATLMILTSKNNANLEVRFRNIYPTSLSGLDYNQQASDVDYLTATVSFEYAIYEFATVGNKVTTETTT